MSITAEQFMPPEVQETDHAAWLEARKTGVGGSDIPAIMGMSRWASAWQVWQDKQPDAEPFEETDTTQWGRIVEPSLKAWLALKQNVTVTDTGTWRRTDEPWMICNPDGFTSDGGGIECKHHGTYAADEWVDGQASDASELQAQWCMAVTGRPHWWIVAKVGNEPPVIVRVEADPSLHELLIERAREFWFDFVLAGVEPEPTHLDIDAVKGKYADPESNSAIAPRDEEHAEALIKELDEARAAKKDAARREDAAIAALGALMGDHDHLLIDGLVALTWKQSPRTSLDQQAIRDAGLDPDDYKTTTHSRTMRVPAKRKPFKGAA